MSKFAFGGLERGDDPVLREIRRFLDRYPGLCPRVFLAYDRTAFTGLVDDGLRITFDTNIRFRQDDLSLGKDERGTDILEPGRVLMEIKTPSSIPLWLCRALNDCGAFPQSFSKYGTAYRCFSRECDDTEFDIWEESTSA
jgi:hypothetical protein